MFDLLVIGGGPAGLMAAYTAKKNGLDTVLVEMKKDVKNITRACSAQFVMDDGYEGELLKIEDGKLIFTKNGFEIPYNGKLVPIIHNYMVSPKGHRVAFEYDDLHPTAVKFDKGALLGGLWELCADAGVDMRPHTRAISGSDNGDHVSVTLLGDEGEYEIKAKKLIIAEGVNCKLTGQFGLNDGRAYFGMPLICNYTVVGTKGIPHNSWIQYYGDAYHPFTEIMVGESTECDDALEITVGGINDMKPDMFFDKLVKNSPLSENLKDAKVIKKMACSVKSYLSLETPYKGNVLSIGDSAGHIEVINQGAIMCGYHAGNAAAKELAGGNGFEEYTAWWNGAFIFNCDDKLGQLKAYGAMNIKRTLSDDEIDYVFSLLEGKSYCGHFDQYEVPRNFWSEVLKHSDRIESERPELYKKLDGIRELHRSGFIK